MDLHAEAFWLPKSGCSESEYEDAFGPPSLKAPQQFKGEKARFAVADGATEASFSRQWAVQLVRGFVHEHIGVRITAEDLKPLQQKWERTVRRRPLPWYAEEKVEKGAFSSLLGLEIACGQGKPGLALSWRAVAVGDSCLFQVERKTIVLAWPLKASSDFGNSPSLLCSKPAKNGTDLAEANVQNAEGSCGQDTAFYLMTDALSCWFLREHERGGEPWRVVADLGTDGGERFCDLVTRLRSSGEMKNDDVTLVRVEVLG
jgi:hypothetical protein